MKTTILKQRGGAGWRDGQNHWSDTSAWDFPEAGPQVAQREALSQREGSSQKAPDGQAPDGQAPDGQAPDGQAPDGQAPDGQAPDGQAPDGQARATSRALVPSGYRGDSRLDAGGNRRLVILRGIVTETSHALPALQRVFVVFSCRRRVAQKHQAESAGGQAESAGGQRGAPHSWKPSPESCRNAEAARTTASTTAHARLEEEAVWEAIEGHRFKDGRAQRGRTDERRDHEAECFKRGDRGHAKHRQREVRI